MYASVIGKLIFERWSMRTGQSIEVKEFFDQVFFPLFFDDQRYLMFTSNSKFDQAYKQKKKKPLTAKVRHEALQAFHNDVETLEGPESHLYMGGYTRDFTGITASQVSHIDIEFSSSEVYYSWLGMACGIGVKGGVSLLVRDPIILDKILDGWSHYRRYMNANPTLKACQIDSWNGWWLIYGSRHDTSSERLESFPPPTSIVSKDGRSLFVTPPWIKVLFALARSISTNTLMTYIYSFGQMNTTIGFVPIYLSDLRKISSLYKRLFVAEDHSRERQNLDTLYETEMGFFQACRIGALGMRAIEPKSLRKYMTKDDDKPKKILINDSTKITFRIYQTWIIAMLNNDDLLLTAQELAEALDNIGPSSRGKKVLSNAVETLLAANTKNKFIEGVTNLISIDEFKNSPAIESKGVFEKVVNEITKMPRDNVYLFTTLIRFKHAYLNL